MSHENFDLPANDPLDRHDNERPFVASVVSSGWVLFRTHASLLLQRVRPIAADNLANVGPQVKPTAKPDGPLFFFG